MKAAHGSVFKYGDNVDTDVIIPARYLNSSDPKELATPVENAPSAPYVHVWESAPIITSPATVSPFSGRSACSIPISPTSK